MKNPIRILQIFTTLNRGGAESMIMNYYRNIDRSKVQFDFIVHREEKGAFEDEIESMGGKIYRMPKINPINPNKYYTALDNFLKTHSYQIIHSHINTFSSFPLKIAEKNNIECRIAHAHIAIDKISIKNILFSKLQRKEELKNIMKHFLKKDVSKYATHKFSCGIKAGNWLFRNKDFQLVENAISIKPFKYNQKVSTELRINNNIENTLNIGHIGRFSEQKNHLYLLLIFRALKQKTNNVKLLLVGDGELRALVENEAKRLDIFDDIIFMGVRSDVPDLLQMMDIFLFPSLYEGLPVTLIEAQASGLKIFASDTITDEVALTDDITFLSLDKSPEFWAEQILNSYPYERNDNSEIIKEKGYDIVESAKRLEEFYLNQISLLEK